MQGPVSQNPQPYGPPYPQQPPFPPPPPSGGVPVWVWIGLAAGVVGLFALVGIFAIGMMIGLRSNAHASTSDDPSSPPSDVSPAPSPTAKANKANLPKPRRSVPVHDVAILTGCSRTDLSTIETSIGAAIEVGAPTYNAGDFQGCYTTYDRAAVRLESALSTSCSGPVAALEKGRSNAQAKATPADRAWAMRDAFDGLVDVVERSR